MASPAPACVGEELSDWLELMPVSPLYRAFFPDGTSLDVHSSVDEMADEISVLCGAAEAEGYRRYVEFVTRLYRYEMHDFIDRNVDSPLGLLTPSLARLVAVGGFRRLAPKVSQFLKDPRTQRVFSFQSMYAGLAPQDALALYAVIAYMDSVAGVFFPRGGMHAVPRALAGAAEKHGVEIRYGVEVTNVEVSGSRAVAVHTMDERIACDAVVLNPDLPVAMRDLLGVEPRRHDVLTVVLPHAGRLAGDVLPDRAPLDPLRAGVGRHLPRADLRAPADVRPVVPRDEPFALGPLARARGAGGVLRPVPDARTCRPTSTGRSRGRATATRSCGCSSRGGTSASATPSRSSR